MSLFKAVLLTDSTEQLATHLVDAPEDGHYCWQCGGCVAAGIPTVTYFICPCAESKQLLSGAPLGFVLAVPGRCYSDVIDTPPPFHHTQCDNEHAEVIWQELRLITAHDPSAATDKIQKRDRNIADLKQQTMN